MRSTNAKSGAWSRVGHNACGLVALVTLALASVAFPASSVLMQHGCLQLANRRAPPSPSGTHASPAEVPLLHANPRLPRVVVLVVWTHYAEMMRWQVATLRVFLEARSMLYLAVLNSHDDAANEQLASMADAIGVRYTIAGRIFGGVSNLHAHAVNHGLAYLRGKNGSDIAKRDRFTRNDILWLLDSDMFLATPTNLLDELNGSHIWSVLQVRENITYCWPNFSVIHFAGLDNGDALLDELDWNLCQGYRGVVFDSGGCTARFLDQHPEVVISPANTACTSTTPTGLISSTCDFLAAQNAQLPTNDAQLPTNDTQCTSAYTIERAGLEATCRADPQARECHAHAKVYHLGSAGSNWRGCSEAWLRSRRTDMKRFLGDQLADMLLGSERGA